uniref:Uncharacterized protein n=1 Tax=Plectus sambesii TaxID=2011161 RepID=A0A914X2W4_9BILA
MWLLIASLLAVHALSAVAAPTTGTNFVFAFPCIGNSANLFVFIANPNNVDASISIYSSDPDFDPIEQSVDAQSTQQIQFYDPDMQLCSAQSQVAQRGVLVQSDQPISVYVDIETTDAGIKYTASVFSTYSGQTYANTKFNIGFDLPAATE